MEGFDLKVLRLREGIKQRELAEIMGVSQKRIANVEAAARPSKEVTERYMDALRTATVTK